MIYKDEEEVQIDEEQSKELESQQKHIHHHLVGRLVKVLLI